MAMTNAQRQRKYKKAHPEVVRLRARNDRLKHLYKITVADYNAMVEKQGGGCAICYTVPPYRLFVDHDPKTGRVRGLLCNRCNIALGYAFNNAELLRRMAEYLDSKG